VLAANKAGAEAAWQWFSTRREVKHATVNSGVGGGSSGSSVAAQSTRYS